ncbi:unnamed protein product (macronuclear) [Paramecium tetraurelia]|uniref:Tetratricopeptide SHNi-TPR domain-containing protein n=1 Tax=Paramecium tetraurelia TaxID=5888 RepID=A0E096_PARTE|nr:uncharacterized protein GSPATT00021881001 [Paramecium tetraurelia]CAK88713.1 unnamed protein product [Paramecium tetraurelia]|eukprot:XP_001456110.1 hypothetical protein (macronuclear) [Paramecium tetraurelia strain d4-2]
MDQVDIETINQQARKAKELFNEGKHNEAEVMMQGVMQQALAYYKDELAVEMAEYYYMYGTIIVLKLSEQQDVFGQRTREAENNALGVQDPEDTQSENEGEQIEDGDIEEEHKVQENKPHENIEDLDDFHIAWENLEVARVILEKEVQSQKDKGVQEFKYMRNLAKVYIKLAELDQWRDKFDDAQENLQKSLQLRLQCENQEISRDIAETYFFLGNVTLYNYKEGKEEEALGFYLKALQILENHLCKLQNKEQKQITLQDAYEREHLKISFLDNEDTKELKQVLSMLYDKVEDTNIAWKEIQTEEWKRAREEMLNKAQLIEQQQVQQQQFTQQPIQEERQIIQLGNFGNARRRVEVIEQQQQNPVVQQNNQENVQEKQKEEEEEEPKEDASKKVKID